MTTQEQQPVTWDAIQKGISEGVITEAQGQQIWAEKIEKDAVDKAEGMAERREIARQVKSEIDRYRDALPALKDKDSAEFKRVQAEFERLKGLGFPHEKGKGGEQTELAALLAAFGPQSALRKKANGAEVPDPEETVETHGGGDGGGGAAGDADGPHKSMSAAERAFYGDLIRQGVVKDWAAANELVVKKYRNQGLRARNGAKLK